MEVNIHLEQSVRIQGGKSESKDGDCGSGAPLTSTGDSGSIRKLGVITKSEHRGLGKSAKKKNNVWHSPTPKLARSLKGQEQIFAAA